MVINMEQTYVMINPSNIVDNTILWDGGSEWTPPAGYTVLPRATTPSIIWAWNLSAQPPEWELTQTTGNGQIGDTWNGTTLTTTLPKPTNPPTVTSGTMKI